MPQVAGALARGPAIDALIHLDPLLDPGYNQRRQLLRKGNILVASCRQLHFDKQFSVAAGFCIYICV